MKITDSNSDFTKFNSILKNSKLRYSLIKNVPKEGLDVDEQDNECYLQIKLPYDYISFYFDEANGKLISIDNELD